MVEDIKLQISLFQHYNMPTLPLHSQQDSSDIIYGTYTLWGIKNTPKYFCA